MVIEEMAKRTKEAKATCKRCLESFIGIVSDTLKKKKQIVITDFGIFSVLKRKARVGVNPATGKKMQIPAKTVPKFKPGKALKEVVG